MSIENALTTRSSSESIEILQRTEPAAEKPANPLLVIHSLLRGRYWLAICLAILGAAIGAPIGYLTQKPTYQSVGVIRVHPILPAILYQTEQNGVMPMFDAFLASQVAQIQSRRVIDQAMLQPEWKALNRGLTPNEIADFETNLTVDNPRDAPLIDVSFVDHDPTAAATAVKAVIQTYERFFPELEDESGTPTMTLLEARRQSLAGELNGINDRIQSIAKDFGSSSLQQVYDFKLSELDRVESQLRQLQMEVALATPTNAPASGATSQPAAEVADELMILRDPVSQELQRQKLEEERQLRVLEYRVGKNHPKADEERALVAAISQDIEHREQELKSGAKLSSRMAPVDGANPETMTRAQLQENAKALGELYENLKKETVVLGGKNLDIEKLRGDADDVRERLAETKSRIDKLNLEKNVGGRITILSYGDVPFKPDKDRRISMACAGGLGMAGLGVGLVLLMGFFDRRMHGIDVARAQLKRVDRLLGVLPELPSDLTDPEQASATAHCIHHIRAMLQIRQRVTGHKTFAITSPSPGDGKTSLTISLGMSLASSGCSTLVIDCDMDGGGLTAKLGSVARKLLGQILLDTGTIGESRLEEGLHQGRDKKKRLGEALVDLGYVSQSKIDEALSEQKRSSPGVGDVLGGAPVENAIVATGYPMLSILPLGSPPSSHSGKLSPESLKKLLDQVGGQFDIVLVDCGPILGSVEAAIVSAGVDGVILLVARGGDRMAAENAVSLLVSAGANIEGIVFNRADATDVASSIFSSSASLRSSASARRSRADQAETAASYSEESFPNSERSDGQP